MATTELSTLLPLVRVRRCPSAVILQALRLSCKQFCFDTEIWEESLTKIASVKDQEEYTLTVEYDDVIILRVTEVKLDESTLLQSLWSVAPGQVLTLDPAPTADDEDIDVKVVYQPTPVCTEVVDWLVSRYGEAIAAGAESRLKRDPENSNDPVPWFDPTSAAIAEGKYQDGVASAKADKLVAMQSGEVAVQNMDFYR